MKKSEVIKAINVKGARVFARVIWGHAGGKALVRGVEQEKKAVLDAIKKLDDDAEFGVNVSKGGHVYINGLSRSEAMEMGEETAPAATEEPAAAAATGK